MNEQEEYDKQLEYAAQQEAVSLNEQFRNAFSNPYCSAAAVMSEEQKARRKAKLDETRQLKGCFQDYLTEVDSQKQCRTLDDWPVGYFKWKTKTNLRGIDIDQFRQDCKEIDNEKAQI